jgi:hypothetical protein
MWKDCARFDDEESAKKYFDYLVKKTWHSRFSVLLYKQDKTTILKEVKSYDRFRKNETSSWI